MISVIVVDTSVLVFVLVVFVVMQVDFMFTRIARLVGVIDGKRRISDRCDTDKAPGRLDDLSFGNEKPLNWTSCPTALCLR